MTRPTRIDQVVIVPGQPDPPRAAAAATAITAARRIGCDCNPETRSVHIEPGVWDIEILHDDWCQLLRNL